MGAVKRESEDLRRQREELFRELDKGIRDMERGAVIPHEETMRMIREELGLRHLTTFSL